MSMSPEQTQSLQLQLDLIKQMKLEEVDKFMVEQLQRQVDLVPKSRLHDSPEIENFSKEIDQIQAMVARQLKFTVSQHKHMTHRLAVDPQLTILAKRR